MITYTTDNHTIDPNWVATRTHRYERTEWVKYRWREAADTFWATAEVFWEATY